MTDNNELYRCYKKSRKNDVDNRNRHQQSNLELEISTTSEVDKLYQAFRQNREPDFENSIAHLVQLAKENDETEIAIQKILDSAEVQAALSSGQVASKSGALKFLLQLPSRIIGATAALLSKLVSVNWPQVVLPVIAVIAISAGIVTYMSPSRNANDFDLAFVTPDGSTQFTQDKDYDPAQVAIALSQYADATANTSLSFSGGSSVDDRAFLLGVSSIDLQIASMADKRPLMSQSIDQMSEFLSHEKDKPAKVKLQALLGDSKSSYPETKKIIKEVAELQGSSVNWFGFGRDVQMVYYSSQLALEEGVYGPLTASMTVFVNQFKKMNKSDFTKPELDASTKIFSLNDKENFAIDELRILRDSARDIKAMRL